MCLTQSMRGNFPLLLVGIIAIHCIPLPTGTVLVGHCGTSVVTVFSVLCITGVMCCNLF